MRTKRTTAFAWLGLTTLIWGAALVVVKPALEITSPFRFLFYRYTLTVVALLIVFIFKRKVPKIDKSLAAVFLANELIGTGLALSLLYWGLSFTTTIETSLITLITPLFVIGGGIVFLKEKETKQELLGLLCAIVGVLLLVGVQFVPQLLAGSLTLHSIGTLLLLLSSLADTTYVLVAKKYYPTNSGSLLLAVSASAVVGFIVFGLFSLAEQSFVISRVFSLVVAEATSLPVITASLYMSVLGSLVALFAFFKGQALIEASEAAVFRYLMPLITVPLGVYVLHEHIGPLQVLGAVLLLLGIVIVEARRSHS